MTITLQALSLVGNVRFTLRLRDRRNIYVNAKMDSYVASNGSCFMVTWTISENHLGGRHNTKSGDHDTPNAHNRCFLLFLSYMNTRMNSNPLQHPSIEGPVTYDPTLQLEDP